LWATEARSSPITFHVSANTSSISGTLGSFDFQFNPGGLGSLAATATITNFQSNGTLVATAPGVQFTGAVSGTLPGTVTLNNTTAFNAYTQNFNFGTTFIFDVTFSGPALDTPNPSKPGSLFALDFFSARDAGGSNLLPGTDPNAPGAALVLNVNPNGTVTRSSGSSSAVTTTLVNVPEPSTLLLLAAGVVAGAAWKRRRSVSSGGNQGPAHEVAQ
jgi:hypothetical protein